MLIFHKYLFSLLFITFLFFIFHFPLFWYFVFLYFFFWFFAITALEEHSKIHSCFTVTQFWVSVWSLVVPLSLDSLKEVALGNPPLLGLTHEPPGKFLHNPSLVSPSPLLGRLSTFVLPKIEKFDLWLHTNYNFLLFTFSLACRGPSC